jgi:hypothetical protein
MSLSYQRHRRRMRKRRLAPAAPPPAAPPLDPQHRYGFALERRAVYVFSHVGATVPKWWRSIRQSTHAEDRAGVDLWVETDRGTVAVQVKASAALAAAFRAEHAGEEIAVVVLHVDMPDDEVRQRVVWAAESVWMVRLREGRRGPKATERRAA